MGNPSVYQINTRIQALVFADYQGLFCRTHIKYPVPGF